MLGTRTAYNYLQSRHSGFRQGQSPERPLPSACPQQNPTEWRRPLGAPQKLHCVTSSDLLEHLWSALVFILYSVLSRYLSVSFVYLVYFARFQGGHFKEKPLMWVFFSSPHFQRCWEAGTSLAPNFFINTGQRSEGG